MKTKNGIELELKKSLYNYRFGHWIFYFSSELYRNKFMALIEDFISMEQQKLKNRYKLDINFRLYFAIALYKKIEKRGFYIRSDVYSDGSITELTDKVKFDSFILKH